MAKATKSKKNTTSRVKSSKPSSSAALQLRLGKLFYPILTLVLIVVASVAGLYLYQQNESGAGRRSSTGTIKIKAYRQDTACITQEGYHECALKGTKDHVIIRGASPGATCNKINVSAEWGVDMGRNRTLKCSPGTYTINMREATDIPDYKGKKKSKKPKTISWQRTIPVERGRTITVNLGTYSN